VIHHPAVHEHHGEGKVVEFVWWGINVFLGCLFGLEVFHQKLLHHSIMHKSLHSGAIYAFLSFSLICLVVLLHEILSGKINDSYHQITGFGLSLVVLAMSLPLLRIMNQSLNVRYTIGGVIIVMLGVKLSVFQFHLAAPVLCTVGVMLQYFGYALLLKKLNRTIN
jgi:hypothetical protein